MPHDISLITTIAAGLGLALILGFLATTIGMPPLHSDEEASLLRQEKLGEVFMGEHELAQAMTRVVLSRFNLNHEREILSR